MATISPTASTEFTGQATTMRAITQDQYGSADVLHLQELDKPAVGDDDVLIGIRAAGVHISDWHLMTGQPYLWRIMGFGFRAPRARVRGMDVAGTVDAVGKHVTRFHTGDAVFGVCDGSFAEYACGRSGKLAPKPRASPSSRRRPYPARRVPRCRLFADQERSNPNRQS